MTKQSFVRALKESEEKYRNIFENTVEGIFQSSPEGRFISVNPAMARMHGYESPEEMVESITDIAKEHYVNPEDRKVFLECFKKEGICVAFEHQLYRKDGNKIWVSTNARAVRDADGGVLYYEGTHEDITSKKTAEEKMRESEQRLNDIINFLPDATLVIDRDGKVIAWNRAVEEMTGVSAETMLGKGNYEYAVPFYGERRPILIDLAFENLEEIEKKYANVQKYGDILVAEAHIPDLLGKEAYLFGKAGILYNPRGEVVGAIESIRDITLRRKTELALQESEERYRTAIESSNDGVAILRSGKYLFVNRKFIEIVGVESADMLIGKYFGSLIHPDDLEMVITHNERRERGEYAPPRYELRMLRPDGAIVYIEVSVTIIHFQGEQATLAFARDITDHKRLETQLLQAQKMEAVGTLAGGIAHDFNNLLMGIQGYASLMLYSMEINHPNYEKLRSIEELVTSGAELTRQLLGFARGGKYTVKTANLNNIIEKTSTMFGRTKKEITIYKKFDEELYPAEVDQGQIEQVLLNLYVNAWQAMPGGGELYLETKNVVLDESYVKPYTIKPGKYIKFSVTDTGTGIDTKTQERIFEPFFTTKEMGRGTGLGLASVYGIIKNHQGLINVYSEKGHGTTFSIYLPASGNVTVSERPARKEALKGTGTILLVDDEDTILQVNSELLAILGYKVITAGSGTEALEVYTRRGKEVDLVILDMIMPDMGGGETFLRLKAINPNVKVVLSSGYSINGHAKSIMDQGCLAFLQKPFNIDELSQKIQSILDAHSKTGN